MAGRGTPATALLAKQRITHTVHAYEHDPRRAGYGQEASDALGVAPERVFKTLVAQVDGALTVGVVPVGSRLDLKALAAAAGGRKAAMADPAAAERATGGGRVTINNDTMAVLKGGKVHAATSAIAAPRH